MKIGPDPLSETQLKGGRRARTLRVESEPTRTLVGIGKAAMPKVCYLHGVNPELTVYSQLPLI